MRSSTHRTQTAASPSLTLNLPPSHPLAHPRPALRRVNALSLPPSPLYHRTLPQVNALFDSFDADGSGTIEYQEINKALRKGNDVKLDPSLQVRTRPPPAKPRRRARTP